MTLFEVESMMRSLGKIDKPPEKEPDIDALKDRWRDLGFKDVRV